MKRPNLVLGIMMKYSSWCDRKPFKSSVISTGVIMITGDVIT